MNIKIWYNCDEIFLSFIWIEYQTFDCERNTLNLIWIDSISSKSNKIVKYILFEIHWEALNQNPINNSILCLTIFSIYCFTSSWLLYIVSSVVMNFKSVLCLNWFNFHLQNFIIWINYFLHNLMIVQMILFYILKECLNHQISNHLFLQLKYERWNES